jgi:membrane-associated protease RseP (regulator of RpoE activity)
MARHLFWVAMAATLSMWLIAQEQRAVAQEQEQPAAEAEADTNAAGAEAAADASAEQSTEQAESQAADTSAEADSQDSQSAADSQAAQSDKHDATGTTDQSSQEAPPSVPAPTEGQDPNATQREERSRVVEGQERDPQDAAGRERGDAARPGRDRMDDRRGRDREDDLRVGIAFGTATAAGLAINRIEQNSFYSRSGFRQGDVIVSVDDRRIRNDADFYRWIEDNPGERVPVIVLRDGRRETIYVTYRDETKDQRQQGGAYLGVVFDPQNRDAAVVRTVRPGSAAEEAGIQPGDAIVALNGQEVHSYADVVSTIRQMKPGDELSIIIERARGENQVVATLDERPNVRTAARPDSQQYDRQTITTEDSSQNEVQVEDRDRSSDGSRGRILPRLRN